jgi:phage tail P2-like protein
MDRRDLLPPSASPVERAIASVLGQISDIPVPIRSLWSPWDCPIELLPWLAWTVAADEWEENWSEQVKREAVASQIALHRRRGTVWAVKRAVQRSGLTARIIEQKEQRAIYDALGALNLDGTWSLDGSKKIGPIDAVAGVPQIQHWAQFIVQLDLAQAEHPKAIEQARRLIDAWKPQRSVPIYSYVLSLLIRVLIVVQSRALLQKQTTGRYPWCNLVLSDYDDAKFQLGKDGSTVTLPRPFGSFRLGQTVGAKPGLALRQCTIQSHLLAQIHGAPTIVGPCMRLGQKDRRLDGSWRLGSRLIDADSHNLMRSQTRIEQPIGVAVTYHDSTSLSYPLNATRLPSRPNRLAPWVRLDASWRVGAPRRRQPFGFRIGRDTPLPAYSAATIDASQNISVSPERLGRLRAAKLGYRHRRLDGSWHLGQVRFQVAPRLGHFDLAYDMNGATYEPLTDTPRRLRLDGHWGLGARARPHSLITIIKGASYG